MVGEALAAKGIEHFIPKIETLTIVRGRHERELRPMLGDYILTSISSIWKSMLRIRGVSGMIMDCKGFPAQVLINELKRMHEMCDDAGTYHSEFETDGFQYGQHVMPRTGPFAHRIGRFDSKNKRGEDVALFRLFGDDARITFQPGDLIAV